MTATVGINGFARIGRAFTRITLERSDLQVVAVNDITDTRTLAHLLEFDSTYGRLGRKVEDTPDSLIIGGIPIAVVSARDPAGIDWKGLGADIVIESTGKFRTRDGARLHLAGVVVVHEASGLNGNIREICGRFAGAGYAALGVDLFEGRNRAVCMARMFAGVMAGNLDHYGVPALKDSLGHLAERPDVDGARIGAVGFCLGGSIVLTWACTDRRLAAVGPFYGAVPRPREAVRRLCPVVGSWPGSDVTTKAAGVLEAELTAAGVPHDLKAYPGARHSFFNDQWRTYDPAAAADSWQRVLAFFSEHVRDRQSAQQ